MVFFVITKKNVHVKYKFIKQDMQSVVNLYLWCDKFSIKIILLDLLFVTINELFLIKSRDGYLTHEIDHR